MSRRGIRASRDKRFKLIGLWRYRVGDYRVLARLEHNRLVVAVVDIGHRSTVYR